MSKTNTADATYATIDLATCNATYAAVDATIEAAPTSTKRTALKRYVALVAASDRRAKSGKPEIPGEAWYTVCHQLIAQAQGFVDGASMSGTERSQRRLLASYGISTSDRAFDAACRADIDHEGMTHSRIRQLRLQAARTHASLR